MAVQTKESVQKDMNTFFDAFENFSALAEKRKIWRTGDKIALFRIFINGVLS